MSLAIQLKYDISDKSVVEIFTDSLSGNSKNEDLFQIGGR